MFTSICVYLYHFKYNNMTKEERENREKLDIGMKLKLARVAAGMSQKELAEKLGISYGMITRYESGFMNPSYKVLTSFGEILGFTVELKKKSND